MAEAETHSHDVFVSYVDADRPWVAGVLLDAFKRAQVRYIHEAGFSLGVPRLANFQEAVTSSARTVLVISLAYLADGLSRFVEILAQTYGVDTGTWPVIPLRHGVTSDELPLLLKSIEGLDAADPDAIERLCAELKRPLPPPPPRPACPYPGMRPFGLDAEGNPSHPFYGRDQEVEDLLQRLRRHQFLAVIGASGSGKSSLVFAGLVPALRRSGLFGEGSWLVRSCRPGKSPLQALTQALGQSPQVPDAAVAHALKAMPDARRLLLVVDQFEETFTLADPAENEPFQTALLRLAEVPGAFVVLTARADFYDMLMAPPRVLWEQIQTHRVEVLSLDNKRLAQAIVEPARVRGVYIDPLLVQRLLADAALEPGVLPLVQETMVLMWERLERRYLSLRDYESLVPPRDRIEENGGPPRTGLQAAIERHAGLVVGGMPEPQQVIARRVFLRLIEFGQGRPDIRRRLPMEELRSRDDDPRQFESTLRTLDENRLLTFSGDETSGRLVDIAHETLIASWPELRRWIGARRDAEQTRRRLEAKAKEWVRLGRANGGLLDSAELPEAERWLTCPDAAELGIDADIQALVDASREAIDRDAREKQRDAREKEEARERERKAAQDLANEQELTIRAQQKAMENAAEILIESGSTALLQGNSLDAMHLFAGAIETMPGSSLDQVTMRQCLGFLVREVPRVHAVVEHPDEVNSAAFSPNGGRFVTASKDKTARVWMADSGALIAELKGHADWVLSAAFSPEGSRIVTASRDKTARVWMAATGALIAEAQGACGLCLFRRVQPGR